MTFDLLDPVSWSVS